MMAIFQKHLTDDCLMEKELQCTKGSIGMFLIIHSCFLISEVLLSIIIIIIILIIIMIIMIIIIIIIIFISRG